MIDQPYVKWDKRYRKITLEELDVGVEYIVPSLDYHTPTELRTVKLHIHTVRDKLKNELWVDYIEYKDFIKKCVDRGEYYSPHLPKDNESKNPKEGNPSSMGLFD